MPAAAATRTTATGASVTVKMIEPVGEDEIYQLAAELQQLYTLSTYLDATVTALKARIVNQLRAEGLDGAATGIRGMFGGASDAVRTANKATQPLRAIVADCENAAKNAHVFKSRMQSLVFDAIRLARELRKGDAAGLKVR